MEKELYRITLTNEKGIMYSWTEEQDGKWLHEGEWIDPFPNTTEESLAFGIVESILQSDNCPPRFHEAQPTYCMVEKIYEPR